MIIDSEIGNIKLGDKFNEMSYQINNKSQEILDLKRDIVNLNKSERNILVSKIMPFVKVGSEFQMDRHFFYGDVTNKYITPSLVTVNKIGKMVSFSFTKPVTLDILKKTLGMTTFCKMVLTCDAPFRESIEREFKLENILKMI